MTRRWLLHWLVAAGGAVVASIVAVPAFIAAIAPALKPRPRAAWRSVGRFADLAVGDVRAAVLAADRDAWPRVPRQRAVYVWRRTETEFVVFSRSCTDMGCALNYDAASACYFCPCHGGIFAGDGRPLAGPPDRPMDRYAHRVRNGELEIDVASLPAGA